jgi:hypothetical protein
MPKIADIENAESNAVKFILKEPVTNGVALFQFGDRSSGGRAR